MQLSLSVLNEAFSLSFTCKQNSYQNPENFVTWLKELNLTLQDNDVSIVNFYDKVLGFQKDIDLWKEAYLGEDFIYLRLSSACFFK